MSALTICDFAICRLDKNTVIDGIDLKTQDDIYYKIMQIGYWLGKKYWRQSTAIKTISIFFDWIFEQFKHVLKLETKVFKKNNASIQALEKAGYIFEAKNKNAIKKLGVVMSMLVYCKFKHSYWSIFEKLFDTAGYMMTLLRLDRGLDN